MVISDLMIVNSALEMTLRTEPDDTINAEDKPRQYNIARNVSPGGQGMNLKSGFQKLKWRDGLLKGSGGWTGVRRNPTVAHV